MVKMPDWIHRQYKLAADGEETGPELKSSYHFCFYFYVLKSISQTIILTGKVLSYELDVRTFAFYNFIKFIFFLSTERLHWTLLSPGDLILFMLLQKTY